MTNKKVRMSQALDELREINNNIILYNDSWGYCEHYALYLSSKQQELTDEINSLHDIVFGDNVIPIRS